MKISGVNLKQAFTAYHNTIKARPKPAYSPDKLEIGSLYKKVEDAKKVKLPPEPKIEEIKSSLKNHTYNVPTDDVAQKMLDDVFISMGIKRDDNR
jgi:anti-sigma28 factor (negative regulator of flagellin synthesis)